MKIELPVDALLIGVTETDIKCMLKAADKDVRYQDFYSPTLEEIVKLADEAYRAEYSKSRHVDKWVNLLLDLEELIK